MSDREEFNKRRKRRKRVVIHVEDPPTPRPTGPCPVTDGPHRWAYLARGGQACGYCGKERR